MNFWKRFLLDASDCVSSEGTYTGYCHRPHSPNTKKRHSGKPLYRFKYSYYLVGAAYSASFLCQQFFDHFEGNIHPHGDFFRGKPLVLKACANIFHWFAYFNDVVVGIVKTHAALSPRVLLDIVHIFDGKGMQLSTNPSKSASSKYNSASFPHDIRSARPVCG